MLGANVTADHGGPVRLYVAPMYGYKSIKWMNRIEVTNEVVPGYWEDNGYPVERLDRRRRRVIERRWPERCAALAAHVATRPRPAPSWSASTSSNGSCTGARPS